MKTILAVDDEEIFRAELAKELSTNKFRVLLATNGYEAIQILDTNKIDLIVSDIKMPIADGFQLLTYVMQRYPTIPVIVMTACIVQMLKIK